MIRGNVKLPKGIQSRVPVPVKSLACDKDVIALYSFGSLAENALKPLSDLDFGILLSNKLDKSQCLRKHLELIGLFTESLKTEEIDLVLLNHAPDHVAFQILKTGTLLLVNDKRLLADYQEKTLRGYLDFKPIRDAFDLNFLEGIGYHG
jgi:predicted nucleotidyltransferase